MLVKALLRRSAPRRANEHRPWQTQALEDRTWLHDNPSAGRRVAPQSVRGCRRHPVAALITAIDSLGHASRPDLTRLRPVQMRGLIVMLQLDTPSAASAATD